MVQPEAKSSGLTRSMKSRNSSRISSSCSTPEQHLPLVLPFRYLGVDEGTLNQLDGVLKPMVDAGYSRNDDPLTAPITVDPVHGYDPAAVTAPATQAAFGGGAGPLSQLLAGAQYVLNHQQP